MKRKVLFLCESNDLYSPMAEALLGRIDPEHFDAISAGQSSGAIHAFTSEVLKEVGLELSQRPRRTAHELAGEAIDYVITFDESTSGLSRIFPSADIIHWKFDDPRIAADPDKQLRAFRMVRDQIAQRLRLFVIVEVRSRATSAASHAPVSPSRRMTAGV